MKIKKDKKRSTKRQGLKVGPDQPSMGRNIADIRTQRQKYKKTMRQKVQKYKKTKRQKNKKNRKK